MIAYSLPFTVTIIIFFVRTSQAVASFGNSTYVRVKIKEFSKLSKKAFDEVDAQMGAECETIDKFLRCQKNNYADYYIRKMYQDIVTTVEPMIGQLDIEKLNTLIDNDSNFKVEYLKNSKSVADTEDKKIRKGEESS
ncbi:unnamed protein product [Heterobilharzia americana]|nr:unnamed protein product [Heterobilharzia americana]CAH8669993.1 unnamed protein product [Heterobilharzia americana]